MSFVTYIKRGLRYIMSGTPVMNTNVQVVQLSKSNLLEGRNTLITGGTSGIGYAIADAFLHAGANVCITGRDSARIETSIAKLKENHPICVVEGLVLNNIDNNQMESVLKTFLSTHCIDILVNNAGINGGYLNHCTVEEYQSVMNTNLMGTVFITRVVADYMIQNNIQGNILNICSASSLRPAISAYELSKWGMRAYTLGLAKSLIKHNIVVNGLAPGPTATPMLKKTNQDDISLPNNPSGRFALPVEIANLAVVLTSGLGRMVVGDILYATGGAGVLTFDDIK